MNTSRTGILLYWPVLLNSLTFCFYGCGAFFLTIQTSPENTFSGSVSLGYSCEQTTKFIYFSCLAPHERVLAEKHAGPFRDPDMTGRLFISSSKNSSSLPTRDRPASQLRQRAGRGWRRRKGKRRQRRKNWERGNMKNENRRDVCTKPRGKQ